MNETTISRFKRSVVVIAAIGSAIALVSLIIGSSQLTQGSVLSDRKVVAADMGTTQLYLPNLNTRTKIPVGGGGHLASTSDRLYIVSDIVTSTLIVPTTGRLVAFDLSSPGPVYTLTVGVNTHAALSSDGTTLYVATATGQYSEDDSLSALDADTGDELWETSVDNRADYVSGPSTLALAPNDERLYVYKTDAESSLNWIDIISPTTGVTITGSITMTGCGVGEMNISSDSDTMYVTCNGFSESDHSIRFVDLTTLETASILYVPSPSLLPATPGQMTGSVLSPDGTKLYAATDNFKVAVVNTVSQTVSAWHDLGAQDYAVPERMVGISDDGSILRLGFRTTDFDFASGEADDLRSFSTSTWDEDSHYQLDKPISNGALELNSADTFAYCISSSQYSTVDPNADTVLRIDLSNGDTTSTRTKTDENIRYLILGP